LILDEKKIKESLEYSSASSFVLSLAVEVETQKGSSVISGTVAIRPASNNKEAIEHLLLLRRTIEASGNNLKTQPELDAEIDEMRRRNL